MSAPDWVAVEGLMLDPHRMCLPEVPMPEHLRNTISPGWSYPEYTAFRQAHLRSGWGTKVRTLCGRTMPASELAYFDDEVPTCPHCRDLSKTP